MQTAKGQVFQSFFVGTLVGKGEEVAKETAIKVVPLMEEN